jgi:hypothetical protein
MHEINLHKFAQIRKKQNCQEIENFPNPLEKVLTGVAADRTICTRGMEFSAICTFLSQMRSPGTP